jgi:hypothetical protein
MRERGEKKPRTSEKEKLWKKLEKNRGGTRKSQGEKKGRTEAEQGGRQREKKQRGKTTGTFRFISRTPIPEIGFPSPILTQEKTREETGRERVERCSENRREI